MDPLPRPRDALDFGDALREQVQRRLDRFPRRALDAAGLRRAAVALVMTLGPTGEGTFVLTRRAAGLRRHPGQWALPGGRVDPGESAPQTALRELSEEVGLVLGEGQVIGLLDDYPTRSGFAITPVVVWTAQVHRLRPNPEEVEAAYHVPLAELLAPDVPRLRRIPESDRPVLSIELMGRTINAPTAAILYQLREVALHGRPTRVADYEEPVFAWR